MLKFYYCLMLLIVLTGCVMPNKVYSLPDREVTVKKDKIYQNDQLFAELRYLGTSEDGQLHEGLAIFYYKNNKEVWIFPKEGWHFFNVEENKQYSTVPEIKEQLKKEREKGIDPKNFRYTRGDKELSAFKPMPSVFDVEISDDGKYVYYKTKGIFFDSTHRYPVEYGITK